VGSRRTGCSSYVIACSISEADVSRTTGAASGASESMGARRYELPSTALCPSSRVGADDQWDTCRDAGRPRPPEPSRRSVPQASVRM